MAATNLAPAALGQRGQRTPEVSQAEEELRQGIALTRSGRFEEAIRHFLKARGQLADDYAVTFNLSLCYVATGLYDRAIPLLNELRSRGRTNADVENLLTQALLGSGKPDEAMQAFERAARLAPKSESLYVYIAEACMDSGLYDFGLRATEIGLKNLPRSARLVFEHGLLLVKLDRLDEAKQDLQKVTKLAPGSDVAHIAEAQNQLFEGNVAEAVRVAQEGIHKGKQHFMLLSIYGEAVLRSGVAPDHPDFASARLALEQATEQMPNYAVAQITLGKLYVQEGRWQDAVNRLNAARGLDPRNPAIYSNLAIAYRRLGDTEQMEQALAILSKLNQEEAAKIRTAPGDRKAGYAERTRPPADPPPL